LVKGHRLAQSDRYPIRLTAGRRTTDCRPAGRGTASYPVGLRRGPQVEGRRVAAPSLLGTLTSLAQLGRRGLGARRAPRPASYSQTFTTAQT